MKDERQRETAALRGQFEAARAALDGIRRLAEIAETHLDGRTNDEQQRNA